MPKITALPDGATLVGTETLPVVQSGVTVEVTVNQIMGARTITSGAGLTGGGTLDSDRTLAVGAGTGITVNADDVALTIPIAVSSGGTGITTTEAITVTLEANQSVTSGVVTVISFDTVGRDANSTWNTSTKRWVPQVAGRYFVNVNTQWTSVLEAGVLFGAAVYKNGAEAAFAFNLAGVLGPNYSMGTAAFVDMNGTTDYIDFRVFHNSSSSQNLYGFGAGSTRVAAYGQRTGP